MPPREWPGWGNALDAHLADIRAADRWRHPRTFDALGPAGTLDAPPTPGTDDAAPSPGAVVSFASNDYLGLTAHPAVMDASIDAVRRWGAGSGVSRLVVGSRPVHRELEAEVAAWKRTDRAILFPTGYAANLGVVTALARAAAGRSGQRPLVVSDALNHASIIDACRLAAADVAIYDHLDVAAATTSLREAAAHGRPALLVSDTVFSMDGDTAPVDDLVESTARTGALLVLDEAHAVFGPEPPIDDMGTPAHVVRMTTLSKTLGSLGGVVAGSHAVVDLLINSARPYIFTTAPSPADTAAGLAALRIVRSDEGAQLLSVLRGHIDRLASPGHPSPIVPIVVGPDRAALEASESLARRGLLVPAIRPPTVAEGTARLRVTLSAAHTEDQVGALLDALAEIGLDPNTPA